MENTNNTNDDTKDNNSAVYEATKKEIAKILINKNINSLSQDELIDMLLDESVAVDVDKECDANRSFAEELADKATSYIGSWSFILTFACFLVFWILLNIFVISSDPYPFILLNLILSCLAAFQAPIIMMSQNRDNARERKRNQNDYRIDLKSELILEVLYDHIEEIIDNQDKILEYIEEQKRQK
ncbi:MAG: DUF1003 domain-containing protein [bacterium]